MNTQKVENTIDDIINQDEQDNSEYIQRRINIDVNQSDNISNTIHNYINVICVLRVKTVCESDEYLHELDVRPILEHIHYQTNVEYQQIYDDYYDTYLEWLIAAEDLLV